MTLCCCRSCCFSSSSSSPSSSRRLASAGGPTRQPPPFVSSCDLPFSGLRIGDFAVGDPARFSDGIRALHTATCPIDPSFVWTKTNTSSPLNAPNRSASGLDMDRVGPSLLFPPVAAISFSCRASSLATTPAACRCCKSFPKALLLLLLLPCGVPAVAVSLPPPPNDDLEPDFFFFFAILKTW